MMDRWQNLEILSNAVLHVLYQHALKSNTPPSIEQISSIFQGRISSSFLEKALERLDEHGFVYSHLSTIDPTEYEIEGEGIDAYQKRLEIPDHPIGSLQSEGIEWLFADAGVKPNRVDQGASQEGPLSDGSGQPFVLGTSTLASVPAADRVVTLDHNQPQYVEALRSLDDTIREFENDHKLDNELGREKAALVGALKAGRELLLDTQVDVRIGTALLVEPLRRIARKYDQALVGALATAALTMILKLFGMA